MPYRKLLLAGVIVTTSWAGAAAAQQVPKSIGISVGSLGNPFFIATIKGAEAKAKELNPEVKVTAISADYDLNKQVTQVDNLAAAGADLVLLNAVDPVAIEPAVKKTQAAGVVVAAFDVSAKGADTTVMTNNVQAGVLACQYIVDQLGGRGDVIIVNGPPVSSIVDRVTGCKSVLEKHPEIKILSDNQDGKASREGGMAAGQGLLTRYPKVDAIFAINDPTAIGVELAARQLNRREMIITSVDGAPDIEKALKSPNSLIRASASQDPYVMAQLAVERGAAILKGNKPAEPVMLLEPKLITSENVDDYKGWTAVR